MKIKSSGLFLLIIGLGIQFVFAGSLAAKEDIGDLRLVVYGFKDIKGNVKVGLYNSKEGYRSRGKIPSYRSATVKVKGKKIEYIFEDVPFGEYTIKLYHDVNSNNKLDTNLMGIPEEDYGISNNVRGNLGLPQYDRAKFLFESKEKYVKIRMK